MTDLFDDYPVPLYAGGLYLPHLDLWLDAREPQDLAVITHAHGDHTGKHGRMVATPETARIACYRRGPMGVIELPYGERWRPADGRYEVELFPAGHVLGSAQALITEPNGRRTVYTGDFKLRTPVFGPAAPIIPCDVLIMEATFGAPAYHFPPEQEGIRRLVQGCRRALESGRTPVVFGYTLGKAQEALHYLLEAGFEVSVHGSIANMVDLYVQLGERFPGRWHRYQRDQLEGRVLLAPTQTRRSAMIANIEQRYTMYLSGWGMDANAKWKFGVDEVIPLSDHADWPDLERYVVEADPQRLYTVHGFPNLSEYFRARGREALHLEPHQMRLF